MSHASWRSSLCALALLMTAAQPARAEDRKATREVLVDEDGGSAEVPVHPSFITTLYFPDKVTKALTSDKDSFAITPMGDALAIRPLKKEAGYRANLNITTETLRISVLLRVVRTPGEALTQVSFKAAAVEAKIQARIDTEVKRRTAAMQKQLAAHQQAMDKQIRDRADAAIAARLLSRLEVSRLKAVERNNDNVIVRATRAVFLGTDAYLVFEIQNRGRSPYRLATVQVRAGREDYAGRVELRSSTAAPPESKLIGVVPAGGTGRGVVVLRDVDRLLGRSLELVAAQPGGRGKVTVDRIVLR